MAQRDPALPDDRDRVPAEPGGADPAQRDAVRAVRAALGRLEVEWVERSFGRIGVTMPGERKLRTECVLEVGSRAVDLHAFVIRRPEQNDAEVYRFLLERNLRMRRIGFAVDHVGDIHLAGSLPLELFRDASTATVQLDAVLGEVLNASDSCFNRILELGFADSIRREWAWRLRRGESTRNLEAFRHLRPT